MFAQYAIADLDSSESVGPVEVISASEISVDEDLQKRTLASYEVESLPSDQPVLDFTSPW